MGKGMLRRALPAGALLAAVALGHWGRPDQALRTSGWEPAQVGAGGARSVVAPPSPLCPAARELVAVSEQAATVTGSLALLEPGERPQAAADAAKHMRELERRAAGLAGGAGVARALADLAKALEDYAGGDPTALGALRAASAQNAAARDELRQHSTCGGEKDE
jgi:hypothetical protein